MSALCRLGLLGALCAFAASCASVNAQSALRLSNDAIATSRSLAQTLEDTCNRLEIYVEGQSLAAAVEDKSPPTPEMLCSIQATQRSLRQRIVVLRKLAGLYDRYIGLINFDHTDDSGAVFDDIRLELDRYASMLAPGRGPPCPSPEPAATPPDPAQPTGQPLPGLLSGLSRARSMRLGSERIREVLSRLITLLDRERALYASLQRVMLLSRKTLARTLLLKYGALSPSEVFAPQLAGLGVAWDEREFQKQWVKWPPAKQQAMRDAIVAVMERRAERQTAAHENLIDLHIEILRALYREHQSLEQGQKLDMRVISQFLLPPLKAITETGCQ